MGKKSDGKGKGSQLVIRIEKAEREAFVTLCDALDTSAAREIRRFMRGFVAAHAARDAAPPAEPAVDPAPTVKPDPVPAEPMTAPPDP